MAVIGIWLGMKGFREREKIYTTCKVGITVNAVFLAVMVGLFVRGLCRMIEERYELALDRIRLMQTEDTVKEPYRDYFKKMAEFVLMLDELRDELLDGRYQKFTLEELRTWNRRLYQDVLPEQYEESYANPDYACKMFGKESGQILGMLYAELRGAVVYVFEGKTEYLAILYELLIEIYNQFEDTPDAKTARDIFTGMQVIIVMYSLRIVSENRSCRKNPSQQI